MARPGRRSREVVVLLQTYLLVKAVGCLPTVLLHLLILSFDFGWLVLFLQLNTSCQKKPILSQKYTNCHPET